MAKETIQDKILLINREIDLLVLKASDGKLSSKENREELATAYKKIESEILGSEVTRALLAKNDEVGSEILRAVQRGIEQAESRLTELEEKLKENASKDFIQNLKEETNQEAKAMLGGIKDLQEGKGEGTLTNQERYEDLNTKIEKAGKLIEVLHNVDEMKEGFGGFEILKDDLGNSLVELEKRKKFEGIKAISGDEVKTQVEEAIKIFEEVEKDPFAPDIVEKLKTMNKKFNELKDTTFMLDKVDLKGKMNITEKFIDNEDGIAGWSVDEKKEWLNDIKTKVFNPENAAEIEISDKKLESINKMLNKYKTETLKFLYSKENQEFLKLVDSENLKKCKPDASIQELQDSIDGIIDSIKGFQSKSSNISEEQLNKFIEEAQKIKKAYEISLGKDKTYKNTVSMDGVQIELNNDEIDFSKLEAQAKNMEIIKNLDDENEFKKLFENEAKKLAGKKPTNKWYQNLLDRIPIIRRFYKSPEKKYEVKLEEKRGDVIKNLTKQNIDKIAEVDEIIKTDIEEYHKKAVAKTFEKKKAIDKGDKNDILSKMDQEKIPPKSAPKKSDGPER